MIRALLAIMLVSVLVLGAGLWYVQHWFATGESRFAPPMQEPEVEQKFFEVLPGTGIASVAQKLKQQGYLAHPRLWQLMARYRGEDRQLKAGEYRLQAGQTPAALLTQLVAGEVALRSLVIVEGTTVRQMLEQIAKAPKLRQTLQQPDAQSLLAQLALSEGHAEGQFFPDTYQYQAGERDQDILRQAYQRMQNRLQSAWAERAEGLPYANPQELLIMASIVEKETGAPTDRAQISQVFVRRLHKRMRLQTDPTVIYGIGEQFDGDIKSADLVTDTPYNTYTRHGLPPTPISLPGAAALHAAANPAQGEYLYFVSRGDGSSQFSKTLDEHNAAVRRYQLRRR